MVCPTAAPTKKKAPRPENGLTISRAIYFRAEPITGPSQANAMPTTSPTPWAQFATELRTPSLVPLIIPTSEAMQKNNQPTMITIVDVGRKNPLLGSWRERTQINPNSP